MRAWNETTTVTRVERHHDLAKTLLADRHALDAIARAVVSGERGLGAERNDLADAIASLMINRLAAANAVGHARVAHLRWAEPLRQTAIEKRYGRELVRDLTRRTDEPLAYL